jgi:iron complex transport system permease protein
MTTTTAPTPAGATTARPGRAGRGGRLAVGLAVTLGVLVLTVGLSLAVGARSVPLGDVWAGLFDPDGTYASAVVAGRVPRTVLGLLVGSALAVSGALIQGLTRNPLGDPGLLGINAGAAASVVTVTALLGAGSVTRQVWAAVPGALLAAVVVYVIGSAGRGTTPVRLVLAGAAVASALQAYVGAVSLSLPTVFVDYREWAVGSFAGRGLEVATAIAPFVVVGLVVALLLTRSLNALALGEEAATALGVATLRTRVLGGAAAALLAAAATAAVGPIAFVGLAVPHVVRAFTGPDFRWQLPYCVLAGPLLMLLADVLGRVVVRPAELMVGVVTAFLGAPVLVAVIRRRSVAAL